jgi:hypothetical protein
VPGAAPRHCLARGPPTERTKYRRIYRYLPLLTLSNLFRVNSRWVDGDVSRFGAEIRPQFQADDFYELRHLLIPYFGYLNTGTFVDPDAAG